MRMILGAALAALVLSACLNAASAETATLAPIPTGAPPLGDHSSRLDFDPARQAIKLTVPYHGKVYRWVLRNGAFATSLRPPKGEVYHCPKIHQMVRLTRSRLWWGWSNPKTGHGRRDWIARACFASGKPCRAHVASW